MANLQKGQPTYFLDLVDQELRDNLTRLEQKLKGLQAEIFAKLKAFAGETNERALANQKYLKMLSEDVARTLENLEQTFAITLAEGTSKAEFLTLNQLEIEDLRTVCQEKISLISKLKEQF